MPITYDKTINGQPVNTTEFRRAICDVLNKYGAEGGRMADLLNAFGPEWDTPEARRRLSGTLVNMARSGVLVPVEGARGYYRTSRNASRERGGVNEFEQTENAIVNVMKANGGVMKMRDIVDALTNDETRRVRYQGTTGRDKAAYRGIYVRSEWDRMTPEQREDRLQQGQAYRNFRVKLHEVIAQSTRIYKISERTAIYALAYEELRPLVLRGRGLSNLMAKPGRRLSQQAIDRGVENAQEVDWFNVLRAATYRHIGDMLDRLIDLGGMSRAEFAGEAAVSKALARFRQYALGPTSTIISAIRTEVNDRLYEPTNAEVCLRVLEAYITGDDEVHLAMQSDFIEAAAAFFKVDAAYLALGIIATW